MKSKYLAFGLSTLLALSLASCGGQQVQDPQEPQQKVQQAEPMNTETTVAPVEVKQEVVPVPSGTVPEEKPNAQDGDVSSEANTPVEIDPAGELFEAVEGGEQTVYVTGTVNIRSTWSTEGEKLGAFNKGQAIVRVGVGIEGTEAEGWSQIKASDGQADDGTEQFKLVYVSNKYLSTTKPSSSQSGNSSGSQGSKPSGSQTQTQAPASKPSGGQQQDPSIDMPSGTPITGNSSTGTTTPPQPSGYNPSLKSGNTNDPEFIESATKAMLGDLSEFHAGSWDEIYGN